jgi:hypothetical protein
VFAPSRPGDRPPFYSAPVLGNKGDKMVEILKFIRPEEAAFDPEAIGVLASALDEAWGTILKSGSRFARPAYSRVMREVVAKRIIEMAQRGVKDQQTLVDDALRFLATNYSGADKHPAATTALGAAN